MVANEGGRADLDETRVTEQLDTGLLSLCGIASFFRVATDHNQLRRELALGAAPAEPEDLIRAAKLIGLKARIATGMTPARLARLPLPAIVQTNDGRFSVLIARSEAGLCRIVDPITKIMRELTPALLFDEIASFAVLITRRFAGEGFDPKTFGFRWFLPSIWRYRSPPRSSSRSSRSSRHCSSRW